MSDSPRFLQTIQRETGGSQSHWPRYLPRTREQLPKSDSGSRSKDFQIPDIRSYEISLNGVGRFGDRAMDALAHLNRPRTILPFARFYLARESHPTQVSIIFGRQGEGDLERLRRARLNELTELVYLICPHENSKSASLDLDYRESLIFVPADVSAAQINSIVQALCPWAGGSLRTWDDPLSFLDIFGGRVTQVSIIETRAQQAVAELEYFLKKRPKSFVEAEKILIQITVAKEHLGAHSRTS